MANQTYQLVVTGVSSGQFVQNVFHFRMDDDSYANRLLAAKGLIDGFLSDGKEGTLLAMLPSNYLMKSIKARRVTNGGGPEYIDTSVDGEAGTFGDDASTSGTGPVLVWFTDGGARRVGKTFLSGISNSNQAGGEISAAALTSLDGDAETFRQSFPAVGGTTPTVTFCIPRSNDPATRSLVVGHSVSKDIGQQRRRQLPV